jgi:hypothetical protein
MAKETWLPAGQFLGERRRVAVYEKGYPIGWQGEDALPWLEPDILCDLQSGKLKARGRRLTLEPLPPEMHEPLIAGGNVRPVAHHVEPIPAGFWRELIFHSGMEGHTDSSFDCCRFRCGDEAWEEVEILEPRNRGGRRPTYDWGAFEAEALARLEQEGGWRPDWRQAAFEREMAEWCLHEWGQEPSESLIRAHVKRAEKDFGASRRKARRGGGF